MFITKVTLTEAADLIETSQIMRMDETPGAVRLDIHHPAKGMLTTIQAGDTIFLIEHPRP